MKAVLAWLLACSVALAAPPAYPPIVPGRPLAFPYDYGSHPQFRTEWWYVTGWLEDERGAPLGFQLTFFRSRPPIDQSNPSRFSARQILVGHAAVSDPKLGRVAHAQTARREGFGLASAEIGDTDVAIGSWSLKRHADGRYAAIAAAADLALELVLTPSQPPLLQGENGYSRKGPRPEQASRYYSVPQLRVAGTVTRAGRRAQEVKGTAWLDHEWSSTLLADKAVGWDWFGINLEDGGALTAFRIRDAAGRSVWSHATLRRRDGSRISGTLISSPLRTWRSPRSGAEYPVALRVDAAGLQLHLVPLMDDQEIDARPSTGSIYWEGAVTALSAGRAIGRGYLELTGYFRPLEL